MDGGLCQREFLGYVKFQMFPDSFPSIPHTVAKLLGGTSESEMVELFGKFLNIPMSEATMVRILEAYIPMKLQCRVAIPLRRPVRPRSIVPSNQPLRETDWGSGHQARGRMELVPNHTHPHRTDPDCLEPIMEQLAEQVDSRWTMS